MALFIEQTLYANLTWAVFQANAHTAVERPHPGGHGVHAQPVPPGRLRRGHAEARRSSCSATRRRPRRQDVANGIVNIVVGFAPLLPAEFVVVKIAQLAGQTQS